MSSLTRVIVCTEDDCGQELSGSLEKLITKFQSHLETIPEEYRESAEIEFSGKDFYGSIELNIEISYVRPMTEEEINKEQEEQSKIRDKIRQDKLELFHQLQKDLGL